MSFQDVRLSSMFRSTGNNRTILLSEQPSTPSTISQSLATHHSNYQRDDINVERKNNSNGHRYLAVDGVSPQNIAFSSINNGSYESYDSSYGTLESTDRAPETLIKPVIRPRTNHNASKNSDYLGKTQKVKLVKDKNTLKSFSLVSGEILHFQQMVSSLGQQIYGLGNAPAELWKCRLQIDTMNDVSKRIETQLQTHEKTTTEQDKGTFLKLTRDFKSVQTSFKNLKLEFGQRQKMNDLRLMQEEMIKKSYDTEDSTEHERRARLQMIEDEYAHDVMRERESEISNINKKMHQVTDIYKDLGQVVSSQQEQIDGIEDSMYAAQDNAKYGLQQLEKAKGKTTKFYRETEDDEDDDSEDEYTQTTNLQPPQIRSESNGECQFPDIETLKEYYVDGKSGIYEFMEYGTNVMEIGIDKVLEVKSSLMQCVSTGVTNYRHRNRKKHGVVDIR